MCGRRRRCLPTAVLSGPRFRLCFPPPRLLSCLYEGSLLSSLPLSLWFPRILDPAPLSTLSYRNSHSTRNAFSRARRVSWLRSLCAVDMIFRPRWYIAMTASKRRRALPHGGSFFRGDGVQSHGPTSTLAPQPSPARWAIRVRQPTLLRRSPLETVTESRVCRAADTGFAVPRAEPTCVLSQQRLYESGPGGLPAPSRDQLWKEVGSGSFFFSNSVKKSSCSLRTRTCSQVLAPGAVLRKPRRMLSSCFGQRDRRSASRVLEPVPAASSRAPVASGCYWVLTPEQGSSYTGSFPPYILLRVKGEIRVSRRSHEADSTTSGFCLGTGRGSPCSEL